MSSAAPITLTDTAEAVLLTGVPGSFKSCRAVHYIEAAIAAGETVFAANFTGLKIPGVIRCEDPTKWQDLPAGSVLVIDEAQDMGFATRRSGEPPAYIKELSKVRKYAVRIIFITQSPTYMDAHIRGIIVRHEHLVRKDGAAFATVYVRSGNGAFDDVREEKTLKRKADDEFKYEPPVSTFDLHESAATHTRKKRMPAKAKKALIIVGVAAIGISLAWFGAVRGALAGDEAPPARAATAAPPARLSGARGEAQPGPTAVDLAEQMKPRIPGAMWSAPLFDGRPVVAQPRSLCMASEDSCTCLSEQGTRVLEPADICRFKARNGEAYNPFLRQADERGKAGGFRPTGTKPGEAPQGASETLHAVPSGVGAEFGDSVAEVR